MAFVMPETREVVCFACGEDLSEGVAPCPACGSEETTLVCRLVAVSAPEGSQASAPVGMQPEVSRA
jgi:RNA polymerase subunit RPABC4/transcription elongation factor Spt4